MRKETFHRALAATARVACCSVLLGCTPKPAPSANPSPQAGPANPGPAGEPAPAIGLPLRKPTSPANDQELLACKTHTRAVFTDKTEGPSDRTKSCCQAIAASLTAEQIDEWRELPACCNLIARYDIPACTPWGPPCPPALEAV